MSTIRTIDTDDLIDYQRAASELEEAENTLRKAQGRFQFRLQLLIRKYDEGKPIEGISPDTGEILETKPDAVVPAAPVQVPA